MPRFYHRFMAANGKGKRRVCHWCGGAAVGPRGGHGHAPGSERIALTKDHLIPRWAWAVISRSLLGTRGLTVMATVPACRKCNNDKGGMPPALFMRHRRDYHLLSRLRAEWSLYAEQAAVGLHRTDTPQAARFIAMVVAAMCEPVSD